MRAVVDKPEPTVAVVLCTWRAGAHLEAQLDSLAAQDWPLELHVFDDASDDDTAERARRHPAVRSVSVRTENAGFVTNFEGGIAATLTGGHRYIALADQDDRWRPERLRLGMLRLLAAERIRGTAFPLLAHSDLALIDAAGRSLHPSFLGFRRYAIGGERALPLVLGQCGVMGNTVLMNRALADLALPFPPGLFVHDWWLALVAELWGERLFEPRATVDYRLHEGNASNPIHAMRPRRAFSPLGPRTLLARDLRLPFKEDGRVAVLEALLAGDGRRPSPEGEARRTIETFVDYLRLARPRPMLLAAMLRGGFLKRGLAHRTRFALALLLSRRYAADGGRRAGSSSPSRRAA